MRVRNFGDVVLFFLDLSFGFCGFAVLVVLEVVGMLGFGFRFRFRGEFLCFSSVGGFWVFLEYLVFCFCLYS